jgi:hypothetical protein
MYKGDRREAALVSAHEVRKLRVLSDSAQEAQPSQEQQSVEVTDAPSVMPAAPPENQTNVDSPPPQPEPASDGSAEIVIPE